MAMKYLTYAAIPLMAASLSTQAATVDQLSKQVQKLNQRIAAADQRFRVNGFASFGMVQSSEPESYHRGITDDVNFRRYTKAGIQMTFNLDSDTSVITQLVSKGENDFETKAEWLYFKHNLGSGFTAKMGRLRKPNYLLSEYFDVGYAMPWTQAPVEVYGVLEESANFEALDLSYDFDLTDDWSATAQVQYGRAAGGTETTSDNLVALNYSMTNGELTLRAGYSRADVAIIAGSDTATLAATLDALIANTNLASQKAGSSVEGSFGGLAAMYDNGTILAIAEYTFLTVDSYFADQDGYYAMGGYRLGQWMPYLTYAFEETTDNSDRLATSVITSGGAVADATTIGTANATFAAVGLDNEQTRTSLGVRYDLKPGVAIKAQYDMVDAGDYSGEFDAGAPSDGKANVLSISIDTVF
jgi:hypothetical protein